MIVYPPPEPIGVPLYDKAMAAIHECLIHSDEIASITDLRALKAVITKMHRCERMLREIRLRAEQRLVAAMRKDASPEFREIIFALPDRLYNKLIRQLITGAPLSAGVR